MNSRTGPFIIIGFVRFTRCAVIESFCAHSETSSIPLPSTVSGCGSFVRPGDRVPQQLAVVPESTSQNVRSMSNGK